ncbi:MAG TPA: DUF488 family protein [Jatrophihabitans sp.]|nr:DUF488 family protein [Jatrophihabitans sp.]
MRDRSSRDTAPRVRVRRVYDPPEPDDGYRVLVDRIWPRGITKAAATLDEWCPDVAPSTDLRRWYGHEPQRYAEFRQRYLSELKDPTRSKALAALRARADAAEGLTLVTATKNPQLSHAQVLAERLLDGEANDG